jgi:hypothetical protein
MHEAFDPEPIRELPADEPRTPMWLPAVGVVLLVTLGGYGLAVRQATATGTPGAPATSATAAATLAVPVAPAAPARGGARP